MNQTTNTFDPNMSDEEILGSFANYFCEWNKGQDIESDEYINRTITASAVAYTVLGMQNPSLELYQRVLIFVMQKVKEIAEVQKAANSEFRNWNPNEMEENTLRFNKAKRNIKRLRRRKQSLVHKNLIIQYYSFSGHFEISIATGGILLNWTLRDIINIIKEARAD